MTALQSQQHIGKFTEDLTVEEDKANAIIGINIWSFDKQHRNAEAVLFLGPSLCKCCFDDDDDAGNILLNILLTSSIPVSRQGANNVSLVCIPTTGQSSGEDSHSKTPACMLIRVKTSEMADELFANISKYKDVWGVCFSKLPVTSVVTLVVMWLIFEWEMSETCLHVRSTSNLISVVLPKITRT